MENTIIEKFQTAERLFFQNETEQAKEIYSSLTNESLQGIAALSFMRLGEIANLSGNPVYARRLLFKAFDTHNALASLITPGEHPSHHYVFPGVVKEKSVPGCPLCGGKGKPYWSYCMVTNLDFQPRFNPVRTWKYCERCHHLYASAYPPVPSAQTYEKDHTEYIDTKPSWFYKYSDVLNQIRNFTKGNSLLEVGVGGGELIAVATEMGFDAVGLDISPSLVRNVVKLFGVDAVCADFMEYQPDVKYGIVCMGDVIEHLPDPKAAIRKAADLLEPDGILWISTPNFESAYSKYLGHSDPMKRVSDHLNYFSCRSLEKLLKSEGFVLLNYRLSGYYNGSMEITARKP